MSPLVPSSPAAATSSPTDDQQPALQQLTPTNPQPEQQTTEMTTAIDIQDVNFDATTRRRPFYQRRVAFADDDDESATSRARNWRGDVIPVEDVTIIDVVRSKRRRLLQNSVECGAAKRARREACTIKAEPPWYRISIR